MNDHHPLKALADEASLAAAQGRFTEAAPLFDQLASELEARGCAVPPPLWLGLACAQAATGALRASTDTVRRIPPEARDRLLTDPLTDAAVSDVLRIGWDAHQMQALLCAFAMRQGRWEYRDGFRTALETVAGQLAGVPLHRSLVFDAFAFGLPVRLIAALTDRFARDHRPPPRPATPAAPVTEPAAGPVRVALISGEFRRHPTCFLHRDLVAALDRRLVHVTGIHLSVSEDTYTAAMRQACDRWLHWPEAPADVVAEALRSRPFDVLWVMGSFQQTPIAEVLARRPVALTVNGLASYYPHGPALVDYSVIDAHAVPPEEEHAWREARVRWPATPYVLGPMATLAGASPRREDLGLPSQAVVLAAMHQGGKMTPESADLWSAILHRCPQAVLWRLQLPPGQERHWQQALARRGIDPRRREVIAPLTGWREHLARLTCADLFLDATPVNGHTTLLEALSRGVPAVSLATPGPAGRIGQALLRAVGLDEACASDPGAYVDTVATWIEDPQRQAGWASILKAHLPGGDRLSPAFDPARQARWWEQALTTMVSRHRAGLPPESFAVG